MFFNIFFYLCEIEMITEEIKKNGIELLQPKDKDDFDKALKSVFLSDGTVNVTIEKDKQAAIVNISDSDNGSQPMILKAKKKSDFDGITVVFTMVLRPGTTAPL